MRVVVGVHRQSGGVGAVLIIIKIWKNQIGILETYWIVQIPIP